MSTNSHSWNHWGVSFPALMLPLNSRAESGPGVGYLSLVNSMWAADVPFNIGGVFGAEFFSGAEWSSLGMAMDWCGSAAYWGRVKPAIIQFRHPIK